MFIHIFFRYFGDTMNYLREKKLNMLESSNKGLVRLKQHYNENDKNI